MATRPISEEGDLAGLLLGRLLQLSCIVLLFSPLVQAGTARAAIGVSVTVVPRATVRAELLPSELEISTADIKRGYVERLRATRVLLGTVAPTRLVLVVVPTAPVFSQVEISTSGEEKTRFGAEGGEIAGWRGAQSDDVLLLDFRFKLLPGIAPGRHPWPVRIEARFDY